MKTLITLFAVIFAVTFTGANAGERLSQEEFYKLPLNDFENMPPHQEMKFDGINDFEKVNQRLIQMRNKKKGDELQSNKYHPIEIETSDNQNKYTYSYDEQGKNGTMLVKVLYYEEWVSIRYWTFTYDEQGNQLSKKEYSLDNNNEPNLLLNSWTYTYNQQGKLLTEETASGLNGTFRTTYTYDDNGNRLTRLVEMYWNRWMKVELRKYCYDRKGNLFPVSADFWDNDVLQDFSSRYSYTYDQQGSFLTGLKESFPNEWVNDERYYWTYDQQGNMLTKTTVTWSDEKWFNKERYFWTYNQHGNKLTEIKEIWSDSQWLAFERYSWIYDSQGNILTELRSYEKNGQWNDRLRETFTYDKLGNMLTKQIEVLLQEQWKGLKRFIYTFDLQGNMTSGLWEEFSNNSWEPYYTTFNLQNVGSFYCSNIKITWTSILDVEKNAQYNTLQISPNPASEKIMLTLPEGISMGELHISNSLGELVKTVNLTGETGNGSIDIFTNELPDGIYLCSIVSGQTRLSKSFVIVR